jgi:hypothetical protein
VLSRTPIAPTFRLSHQLLPTHPVLILIKQRYDKYVKVKLKAKAKARTRVRLKPGEGDLKMGLRIKVSVNRKLAGNETALTEEVGKLEFNTYTLPYIIYTKAFRFIRIRLKKQGVISRYNQLNDPRTLTLYLILRIWRFLNANANASTSGTDTNTGAGRS